MMRGIGAAEEQLMRGALDVGAFTALQGRLADMWPSMTIRGRHDERTLVVLSSIDLNPLPPNILPLVPAYEERYLFYVLALARAPRTRVMYVTSQPVLPRLLDYYLDLVPGIDRADLQGRVVLISVGDWSPRPLAEAEPRGAVNEGPLRRDRRRGRGSTSHAVIPSLRSYSNVGGAPCRAASRQGCQQRRPDGAPGIRDRPVWATAGENAPRHPGSVVQGFRSAQGWAAPTVGDCRNAALGSAAQLQPVGQLHVKGKQEQAEASVLPHVGKHAQRDVTEDGKA